MCNYLKTQGRAWALETVSNMLAMTGTKKGRATVIATIALGKIQKPEGYALGVQTVIDDMHRIEERRA